MSANVSRTTFSVSRIGKFLYISIFSLRTRLLLIRHLFLVAASGSVLTVPSVLGKRAEPGLCGHVKDTAECCQMACGKGIKKIKVKQ